MRSVGRVLRESIDKKPGRGNLKSLNLPGYYYGDLL